MPTLSEFVLTIGLRYEETEDQTLTVFTFETERQFRSFRYQIEVHDELDRGNRTASFNLKGVLAPSQILSSSGPAVCEIAYPYLEGEYQIDISGAKQRGSFRIRATADRIRLVEGMEEDFVKIVIADQKEIVRG